MKFALSIGCFVIAAIGFLNGFITEYRQSRLVGQAVVPTMQWAVFAAIFVMFGLWHLPNRIPLWILPIAFFGSTIVCGYAITKANQRG